MKSTMRLIKSALEYRQIEELNIVPRGLRGIYALYKKRGRSYDLVYVEMSAKEASGRIRNRLYQHKRSKRIEWTHFSFYEVWDNISDHEICEMEGLFRQLYRFDSHANFYNKQQTHRPLLKVRKDTEKVFGLSQINKKVLGIK